MKAVLPKNFFKDSFLSDQNFVLLKTLNCDSVYDDLFKMYEEKYRRRIGIGNAKNFNLKEELQNKQILNKSAEELALNQLKERKI